MNRPLSLWVWISVVILGVVLIITLFPFVLRNPAFHTILPSPKPIERIPFEEQNPEFRDRIEKRIWSDLSRNLPVGAIIGLIAGVLLTRWLVAPLQQLEKGARAVAKRQLDYRVPVRGSKEMQSVALSFNQMATELEHQEILRRNMLADVTHELRHPTHILQGSLQAILDSVYPLSMQEIDRMLTQTQSLTALLNDLYELALAEAHELPLYKQETDLVALVANFVETIHPLATQKKITLKADYPSEPIWCHVDAARIRQVMQNLLSNALRYTPEGGEIKVVLTRSEMYNLISVQDTGAGVTPENLSRVFDRFYREDSSRDRNLPGTGLGLAIAQAIVQAHGGWIEVESAGVNQGSTFTVKLPIQG